MLNTGFLVIILFAAMHAPTRKSRTLFGLAFGACLLVVAESAPVAG